MPSTPEHKAKCFRLAQERRRQGEPQWRYRIRLADVFRDESRSFEECRDEIVSRIRESLWFRDRDAHFANRDEFDELAMAVEGLESSADADDFNGWWDEIYGLADLDRAWIET